MIYKTTLRDLEVPITCEDVAKLFCNMDEVEQSRFFNHVATITKSWEAPFCFQLEAIRRSPSLSEDGRKIMQEIGEYAK